MSSLLLNLGLTTSQILVYKKFLKSGPRIAADLAREMNMDKATVYRAVEVLEEKGLLIKTPKVKGSLYEAADPELFQTLMLNKKIELESQSEMLKQTIEDLKKMAYGDSFEKSFISVEKGRVAHRKTMEAKLLIKEQPIRETDNTMHKIYKDETYIDFMVNFIKRRVQKKIKTHQLVNLTSRYSEKHYSKSDKNLYKEVRIIPENISTDTTFSIVDDTIFIKDHSGAESIDDVTIITVKNKFFATLLKQMFDFIWVRSAEVLHTEMPSKKFGSARVPTLGIGSWGVGGYMFNNKYTSEIHEVDALRQALGLGMTYIDACLDYSEGRAVSILARGLQNFPRDMYFINAKYTNMHKKRDVSNIKEIERQCDEYLKIFNTEYIDSFMIHNPRLIMTLGYEKTMKELDRLIDIRKIRSIAVSNFSVNHMKEAMKYTRYGISAHETHYNLVVRAAEESGVVDFCNKHNILIISYKPIRRGYFSDTTDPVLNEIAQKYTMTTTQVALNWLASKENVMMIVKSTNASHINENAAALSLKISKEDLRKLDKWRLPGYTTPEYDLEYEGKPMIRLVDL